MSNIIVKSSPAYDSIYEGLRIFAFSTALLPAISEVYNRVAIAQKKTRHDSLSDQ